MLSIKIFLSILAIIYIIKILYKFIFILGKIKINLGEYSIRRIKYNFDTNTIDELKTIAMNSVNTIPNNPFFKGENLDNKIALIIYHKNKPIGFNVMFDYEYKKNKCLHIGLVLIDKNYRGKKIQTYTKYNIIMYLLENIFSYIYMSDLGRSASGLKIFNQNVKNSYPNLINKTYCLQIYKEIFKYFLENFKSDTQTSINAIGDINNFIIKNSNDVDGGANYLVKFNDTTKSKDEMYNNYINKNLGINDEILSIGKVNIMDLIF